MTFPTLDVYTAISDLMSLGLIAAVITAVIALGVVFILIEAVLGLFGIRMG